ncbi:MAG: hypothetical protein AAF629_22755 [Chloroflexota bacterium]
MFHSSRLSMIIGIGIVLIFLIGCGNSTQTEPDVGIVFVTVTPGVQATETPLADITKPLFELEALSGSWGGEFKLENQPQWTLLVAEFTAEATGLTVLAVFPLDDSLPAVTSPVDVEARSDHPTIRFSIPYQTEDIQDTLIFTGQLQDNKIVGAVIYGDQEGVFELAPLIDFGPSEFQGRT